MVRRLVRGAVAALVLALAGCEIEQVVTLEEDLSGSAVMDIEIDLEQMIAPLLAFAPDEASREQMRREMLQRQRDQLGTKVEEIRDDLPDGITAKVAMRDRDDVLGMTMEVGFAHLTLLDELRTEGPAPFDIDVVQEGNLLTLTFDAFSSERDDAGEPAAPSELEMPRLGLSVALEAPFEVVEHNGTLEGKRVTWRTTAAELHALEARGENPPVPRIVYLRGEREQPTGEVAKALKGKSTMTFVREDELLPIDVAVRAVTQRQWKQVVGGKPASCEVGCGKDLPVQNVSWRDAIRFANALSEREGLERCYVLVDDRWTWPGGRDCPGFRLPTASEWRRLTEARELEGLYDEITEWLWDATEEGRRYATGDRAYWPAEGQNRVGVRMVRTAR